jgi:hypothetical protein
MVFKMTKFYISEENLGDQATREQAERLIKILQEATPGEQMDFDTAFSVALEQVVAGGD